MPPVGYKRRPQVPVSDGVKESIAEAAQLLGVSYDALLDIAGKELDHLRDTGAVIELYERIQRARIQRARAEKDHRP